MCEFCPNDGGPCSVCESMKPVEIAPAPIGWSEIGTDTDDPMPIEYGGEA